MENFIRLEYKTTRDTWSTFRIDNIITRMAIKYSLSSKSIKQWKIYC